MLQSRAKLTWLSRRLPGALLGAIVIATTIYVIGYPFLVAELPPITDLPFHATAVSILRHYFDDSFGFRQQFTLHPVEVPYISMYVIGALFTLVMPATAATKASTIVMLALLPAGLAVLLHGLKKTPLWALLVLPLVWTNLTWWGFINHMGAIGLYMMAVGAALLVVDRPTRKRQVGLALALLAVFFTHIFRFPFAVLSVIGAAVLFYPATRRILPIALPLLPSLALFGIWLWIRPAELPAPTQEPLALHPERLKEAWTHVSMSFAGAAGKREQELFEACKDALIVVASTAAIWAALSIGKSRRERSQTSFRDRYWSLVAIVLPLVLAGGFLLAYLLLPMRIGIWWYVYPRELTTALVVALAAVPNMPRMWWLKLPLVAVSAIFAGQVGYFAALQFHEFDKATADFRRVAAQVKRAPKLLYLVFEHGGSSRRVTPFIHLPAWVQAEKGGALSFQFIGWNAWPIRYRENSPDVPAPVPDRWEWTPYRYRHAERGAWFDEFLIRSRSDPSYLFRGDPSVQPVAHDGTWWLYRRRSE